MSPLSDSRPASFDTRRKLLRAGFGVPVITTVASGSALAATSNTCLVRQVASPTTASVTTSPDRFIRVELGKFTTNSNNKTFFVDGNNIAALNSRFGKGTYLTAGQYRAFTVSTNTEGTSNVTPPTTGGQYTRNGGKFAVVRFDATGKIVGTGQSGTPGQSAVTQSCWSSLTPTTA